MRYQNHGSFGFRRLDIEASDEDVYDLATAFSTIQEEPAQRISTVLVRRLA
jgi:hypothetical protein